MFDQIFSYACDFVRAVLSIVISYACVYGIVPWLKDITRNAIIKSTVKAAEQIYKEHGMGLKKKDYVRTILTNSGILTEKNYKYIDMLIEAAVKSLDDGEKIVTDAIEEIK